jgi:hypothetical protein
MQKGHVQRLRERYLSTSQLPESTSKGRAGIPYRNIVQAGHMPRTDPSKPLKPTKRQRKDDDDDNGSGGLKNSRVGGIGTSLALQY